MLSQLIILPLSLQSHGSCGSLDSLGATCSWWALGAVGGRVWPAWPHPSASISPSRLRSPNITGGRNSEMVSQGFFLSFFFERSGFLRRSGFGAESRNSRREGSQVGRIVSCMCPWLEEGFLINRRGKTDRRVNLKGLCLLWPRYQASVSPGWGGAQGHVLPFRGHPDC